MATVLLPAGFLKPVPDQMRGVACASCDRPLAMWELLRTKPNGEVVFLCSPCVLYNSPFSALPSVRDNLAGLVSNVEEAMQRPLTKDEHGRLEGADADRVVFSIVIISNMPGRK